MPTFFSEMLKNSWWEFLFSIHIYLVAHIVIVMMNIPCSTRKLKYQLFCAQFSLASIYCPPSLRQHLYIEYPPHTSRVAGTAKNAMVTKISPYLQETSSFKGNPGKQTKKRQWIVMAICSKKIIAKTCQRVPRGRKKQTELCHFGYIGKN